MTNEMQQRDLEQTITRLQNLSDNMIATRIPVGGSASDIEAAKQRRADGVELREAMMPLSARDLAMFRAILDEE
ncbi:hypothetical protein [Rhodococcoides fascians]|uniref:hypothetical protein n=1 Tax=Rhodococcoides fascians TaxID=1828 RepID=UPI00055E21E1|nr:hypothetical protein [Rhodococcus fascians]